MVLGDTYRCPVCRALIFNDVHYCAGSSSSLPSKFLTAKRSAEIGVPSVSAPLSNFLNKKK